MQYDVCDVTLGVYPLENMPGHGGNRTFDLWNTSPIYMLCQLSYAVRSVRVCDISERTDSSSFDINAI